MITYVLVIVLLGGGNNSVTTVTGYESMEACEAAQKATQILMYPSRLDAVCIPGPTVRQGQ